MSKTRFERSSFLPTPAALAQLHAILRSNTLPSDIEHEIWVPIQSFLDKAPSEVARYDVEIEALEDVLAILKSDRKVLESYANGCRSISSPIKHLPTEVLVQIFGLCSLRGGNGKMPTPAEEMERVSQNHLLRLSQVCAYWHRIAMGTPSLWSTLVVDTHVWPRCSEPPTTLIRCITSALQRGGEFPLSLDIVVDSAQPIQQTLLELLSRHSHRWKSLCIMLPMSAFRFLSDAKGNLPLLEALTLVFATHDDTSYTDDIFEIAPRLEHMGGAGFPVAHPRLPWAQLRLFNYQNGHSRNLSLDMLTHLSQTVQLLITPAMITAIPFGLHPVTSNAETLIVGFITDPDPPHTRTILGAIMECLTLPSLGQLRFIRPDVSPPLWNQPKFVDFAARSSLCDTLTTFEVWAKIAEDDLVECLSLLRSLQVLLLWDCPDYTVITDSLLHHISWAGENSLLPHLRHLCLTSHLRIQDESLQDCITSRIAPCRFDGGWFAAQIFWIERELSPEFVARMSELDGLTFLVSPDVVFW